jgi:uncharacterized protein (TIGR03437 family)
MRLFALFLLTVASCLAQPTISAILDGAAYTPDLAQGTVFVVKGTGLSAPGTTTAAGPNFPTTLNSVRITLTAVTTRTVVDARMVYTYNDGTVNQLAAVLPSDASLGAYELRVQNGAQTSQPVQTTVVARKPGIVTASGDGSGPAQATLDGKLILQRTSNLGKIGNFDTRPARPGERVDLWGTGLGADLTADTGGAATDQTTTANVRVLVNGFEVTPLYAGRSPGSPGLDQIVFMLPATTPVHCAVDVQIRVGSTLSNSVLSNNVTLATATTETCPTNFPVRINEVESNGGTPGDWVEFFNSSNAPVSLAGYVFKDNDNARNHVLPTTAIVPANGYLVIEEADFAFGLGTPDQARLFRPDGTLADSYSWTPHATTSYGRCPNGSGPLVTTTGTTKGAANLCTSPVRINEIESDAGSPADWIELYNPLSTASDLAGFSLRNADSSYVFPSGASVPPLGYLVVEQASLGFALAAADTIRLFDQRNTLVDTHTWTAHATTTLGRCPNGTGAFATTLAATKALTNSCPGDVTFSAWPGSAAIRTADVARTFNGNLSGLIFEASNDLYPFGAVNPDVLWAVRNGPGTMFALVFDGANWVPDITDNWRNGRPLRFPDGTGDVDAEGIAFADFSANGIYVGSERNNSANTVSRNSILRYDPFQSGLNMVASKEWNLTADLPTTGPNLGIEALTWVPDQFLTDRRFFDESKNRTYNPGDYPNHGDGLFFVGLEANGTIYAYALGHGESGGFTRVATITTGFSGIMELQFDRELHDLWAVCDDTCQGRSVVLRIGTNGRFQVTHRFERPATMPNINNEGFALGTTQTCQGESKPVYWADDAETGGFSLRTGTIPCKGF